MNGALAALPLLPGFIGLLALMVLWGGFFTALTVSYLWGWFVVPLFGLPPVSLVAAYGLALTFRALQGVTQGIDQKGGWARAVFLPPLRAALFLTVGYVAKGFL